MTTPAALDTRHPAHDEMSERWGRYRAFTGNLETREDKSPWLSQGRAEWKDDYHLRLDLTHAITWSEPAIERMAGSLTKIPASLDWPEESDTPEDIRDKITEFRENADGTGRNIDSWWRDVEPEVLAMGSIFAEIASPPVAEGVSLSDRPLPFICVWSVEEFINWETDEKGNLLWVILHRTVKRQASWDAERAAVQIYRVLTRETGLVYEVTDGDKDDADIVPVHQWRHDLGIVPLVMIPARQTRKPMIAKSYIDGISKADQRVLQLESDQANTSYKCATALLAIATERPLGTVTTTDPDTGETIEVEGLGLGTSPVLKLKPGDGPDKEWAEYVTFDTGGMEIRERIITRTQMQALNAAGIDPSTVTQGDEAGAGAQRSGVSLAWSFANAEEPILNGFTENMDAADSKIHEIVMRYLLPRDDERLPGELIGVTDEDYVLAGGADDDEIAMDARARIARAESNLSDARAAARVFDGIIERVKQWDMMSAQQSVDLAQGSWDLIKSALARRLMARDIVNKLLRNATPEEKEEVYKELLEADYEPMEQPDAGLFGQPDDPDEDGNPAVRDDDTTPASGRGGRAA